MHYDLLQKYIFFCFADMVVPFCDKLNSAVNLLHCLAAWIHPVYIRTCAALLLGFVFEFAVLIIIFVFYFASVIGIVVNIIYTYDFTTVLQLKSLL